MTKRDRELDRTAMVLLEGTTGINIAEIQRGCGLSPKERNVRRALIQMEKSASGRLEKDYAPIIAETRDLILLFIFQRLNRHVLLSQEDQES